MKRILRRALGFTLALIISVSIIPSGALALFEKYNYVSLGDSLSNGYALEGFESPGYKLVVKESYPYLFAKEIDAKLTPLAYSGLRAEDIYFLLNEEYEGDDFLRRRFIENNSFKNAGGGVSKMRADYKEAISKADYVSITMGGNNFTTYLQAQFEAWNAGEPFAFDRAGYNKSSKLVSSKEFKEIEENARKIFTALGKGKEFVELAIGSLRYTYTGFVEYFDLVVGEIYKLNPDVILIVNGMNNPMDGVHLKNGILNIGKVVRLLADHANDIMKNKTKYSDYENYLFVDIMDAQVPGTPDNLLDDEFFALFEGNKFAVATHPNAEGHAFIKDKMIERVNAPYYDVSKDDTFYDAVAFVTEEGLMEATKSHTFAPYSLATKGMIATALYRAAGEPELESEISFIDVREGSYYKDAVVWAVENEIMKGVTKKIFLPYAGVTRQNFALMLWTLSGQKECDSEYKFSDSFLISKAAKRAVNWAVENGVLNSYGKFISPRTMLTRAELAQALLALDGE
ncbi:MAG: S-layer homology domain-containing protein [Clostridia bacterium]|nr:S-layer homology domain-containing protein [Clostridia bacterium]